MNFARRTKVLLSKAKYEIKKEKLKRVTIVFHQKRELQIFCLKRVVIFKNSRQLKS